MDYAGYAKKDIEIYLRNIRHHYKGMLGVAPRGVAGHLHQIRVNARRLRNALSIYKDLFLPRQLKQWNKSVRRAVEVSSRARDLDVYIRFLDVYATPLARLAACITALKKERGELQPWIIRALEDLRKRDTLADIARSLRRSLAGRKDNGSGKIYKVARKKLLRRVKSLMAFEPFVCQPRHRRGQPGRARELHQMRIAAKHLRYTLEGFKDIYGPRLPLFIARVVSFHRQLGDIHDYDVWTQHLGRYARVEAKVQEEKIVLSKVRRHCLDLRQKTYRAFVRNWARARAGKFFEDLLEYVYAH